MATYYVRNDGSNANTGTGPGVGQAWQTLTKALGATGISSGDIVYVAPGRYLEAVTVGMTSATSTTRIIGDPTASLFSGVNAGEVLWTGLASNGTRTNASLLTMTSKNYLSFENIHFEVPSNGSTVPLSITASANTSFVRCQFTEPTLGGVSMMEISPPSSTALNLTIDSCYFLFNKAVVSRNININGSNVADNTVIKNCLVMCGAGNNMRLNNVQFSAYNNTFIGCGTGIENNGGSTSLKSTVRNNLFIACSYAIYTSLANVVLDDYNRFIACINLGSTGANNSTLGGYGIYGTYALQQGLVFGQMFGTNQSSPNTSFGSAIGAPTTDIYGVAWSGTSPDAGSATFRSIGAVGNYLPTERNASTITIPSGSTSQSVELYLGATGLTATTNGLNATYNKNRTTDVAIPLVARTISQPWVAGGFAEVNPTTMPGVYRLDLPNDAVSAGYGNTTVVVRGATGTNGAVVTIQETQAVGTQLRMGPFTVQADGILTDDRLKLIQGSVHSIDFKMVDAYGTGVDGTGTVVTAKVYNAAGFLIDTYTCTAMYALDGRYSFAIDSTVTDNVGMYTINIYRQIGTETNVFGRMKLEVLSP
jgi:hypothetical protein